MIGGAIEITTDGTPIVLGPDHPTTGGYPVLAVLRAGSQSVLGRRRPGDAVRFVDGRIVPR
jgi:allophanate hydrolase subunit 2